MSRTNIIKLYVDDTELGIIEQITRDDHTPTNRYLRELVWKDALERGYNREEAAKFLKIYIEEK